MPTRSWPVDPLPPRPRWVLMWAQASQHGDGRGGYRWRWGRGLVMHSTREALEEHLFDLMICAAEHYAGDRFDLTDREWRGGGVVTLADVEVIDLRTMTRRPVPVLARIQRRAAAVKRERDRWLADHAARERAEKLAQIERLRREVGDP